MISVPAIRPKIIQNAAYNTTTITYDNTNMKHMELLFNFKNVCVSSQL